MLMLVSAQTFAQPDADLTEKEKTYRDSIANLNAANENNAASQDMYNTGIELFKSKKYNSAILKFKKAIELNPQFKDAYYNKCVAENEIQKYSAAAKSMGGVLKIDPTNSKALSQRARAYQGMNKYVKAEADYTKAISLDSKNEKAYYNMPS